MVAIIDYGLGNLSSVQKALNFLEISNIITSDKTKIENSNAIILPGVGSFEQGMKNLKERNLIDVLTNEILIKKKKFLGICLGMQLLFEYGNEPKLCKGLGWLKGKVEKIKSKDLRLPHLGWNNIKFSINSSYENNMESNYYFIHSYHIFPRDLSNIHSYVYYGKEMVASIKKENIFATQFHPEKSQTAGLKLLAQYFK
tara:strand:- start:256 stop:852 length:597 start_codon:yes stop_codon:yes gene_type:complete